MPEITFEQSWKNSGYERFDGSNSSDSAELHFLCRNAEDEHDVLEAAREQLPGSFHNIPRKSVSISERLSQRLWLVEASYAKENDGSNFPGTNEDADPQYNFDLSGGNTKIVFPVLHKKSYPATAECLAGIKDGEGVEVILPVFHFSETHTFRQSRITTQYKLNLASLVGKINNAPFKGFGIGEVLFTGCHGSRTGDSSKSKWNLSFEFAVSFREVGKQIGQFTGIEKGGWDYLWTRTKEKIVTDKDGKTSEVKEVQAVFVDQIYAEADFKKLGIG